MTDRGAIKCDHVVVGVGPWIKHDLGHARPAARIDDQGPRRQAARRTSRCGPTGACRKARSASTPSCRRTNDGRMPPVIHVDTDAPLYSDVDGSLITDKLWGIYYKPDFSFNGVQGGAMPYQVETTAGRGAGRSLRPGVSPSSSSATTSPHMWCSALALLPEALRGPVSASTGRSRRAASAASRRTASRSSIVFRENCYVIADSQSRLQDDRRRQAGRERDPGRRRAACWSRSASRAMREGKLHPVSNSPFPWS